MSTRENCIFVKQKFRVIYEAYSSFYRQWWGNYGPKSRFPQVTSRLTVHYSVVQCSTVQYCIVQNSTEQQSVVQNNTVQYRGGSKSICIICISMETLILVSLISIYIYMSEHFSLCQNAQECPKMSNFRGPQLTQFSSYKLEFLYSCR